MNTNKANKTKETNKTNVQKVFSRRVALELRKRGYKIIGTEVNFRQPELDVYCFEKTDDLLRTLYSLPRK